MSYFEPPPDEEWNREPIAEWWYPPRDEVGEEIALDLTVAQSNQARVTIRWVRTAAGDPTRRSRRPAVALSGSRKERRNRGRTTNSFRQREPESAKSNADHARPRRPRGDRLWHRPRHRWDETKLARDRVKCNCSTAAFSSSRTTSRSPWRLWTLAGRLPRFRREIVYHPREQSLTLDRKFVEGFNYQASASLWRFSR